MRHLVIILIVALSAFSEFSTAQLRLDADIRLGRSNAKRIEDFKGIAIGAQYNPGFSFGIDAKIGYEFKYGIGVATGLSYDKIRYFAAMAVYEKVNPNSSTVNIRYEGNYPHSSDFITIPVRLEYRFCHDIIRPYVGYGVSFQVHYASNYTDDLALDSPLYEFHRNYVIPTFMFGIDLEYKRFIFGFGRRKDQKEFWREENCSYKWTASQNTFRLGYRLF